MNVLLQEQPNLQEEWWTGFKIKQHN
jgi:hypothetical protein